MLAKNNVCHAPRDILMSNKSGWSLIEYLILVKMILENIMT